MTESILSSLSLFPCFDKFSSFSLLYLYRVCCCDSNRRSMVQWMNLPSQDQHFLVIEDVFTPCLNIQEKWKPDGIQLRIVESRYSQNCKHVPWFTDWNFSIEASNGFHEVYPTLFWAVKFTSYISKHWMDIESLWRDISNTFSQVLRNANFLIHSNSLYLYR